MTPLKFFFISLLFSLFLGTTNCALALRRFTKIGLLAMIRNICRESSTQKRDLIVGNIERALEEIDPALPTFKETKQSKEVRDTIKKQLQRLNEITASLHAYSLPKSFVPKLQKETGLHGPTTIYSLKQSDLLGSAYGIPQEGTYIGIARNFLHGSTDCPHFQSILLHEVAHILHRHTQEVETCLLLGQRGIDGTSFNKLLEHHELEADLYATFMHPYPFLAANIIGKWKSSNPIYKHRSSPEWKQLVKNLEKTHCQSN